MKFIMLTENPYKNERDNRTDRSYGFGCDDRMPKQA